jgi:hypothetical protein
LDQARDEFPGHPGIAGSRAYAYAVTGARDEAAGEAARLAAIAVDNTAPMELAGAAAWSTAAIRAGLGDADGACDALSLAVRLRASLLLAVDAYPFFRSLRGDARFERIRAKVGLGVSSASPATP